MDSREYAEYCARVADFVARIQNSKRVDLSDQPYFSNYRCDVCNTSPGFRIFMVGFARRDGEMAYFEACLDCNYCLEHGPPTKGKLHRVK